MTAIGQVGATEIQRRQILQLADARQVDVGQRPSPQAGVGVAVRRLGEGDCLRQDQEEQHEDRRASSPDYIDGVPCDLLIRGHHDQILHLGLRDQQAVKWIAMMKGQVMNPEYMMPGYRQYGQAAFMNSRLEETFRTAGHLEASGLFFDDDLPAAGSA